MFRGMTQKIIAGVTAVSVASSSAFAGTLTAPAIDTDNAFTVAGAVLGALGIIWGIKAALRMLRG